MQENSTKAITDMASSVNKLVEKLDKSDDVAKEALDKSKSALKRWLAGSAGMCLSRLLKYPIGALLLALLWLLECCFRYCIDFNQYS